MKNSGKYLRENFIGKNPGVVILVIIIIIMAGLNYNISTFINYQDLDSELVIDIKQDTSPHGEYLDPDAPGNSQIRLPVLQGTRGRQSTYTAYDLGSVLGGSLAGAIESGNFDNDAYHEIVAVGATNEGHTNLIDYNLNNDSFDSKLLWWDANGSLVDIAVGELDESRIGPEILVGGYSGELTLLKYHGFAGVTTNTIWKTSFQNGNTSKLNHIFGIEIGDIDERFDGNEIAVVDAATYNVYILANDGNTWKETIVPVEDLPRNVVIGDFDTAHPGFELLVLCVNGTVYKLTFDVNYDNWSVVEVFKDSNTPFSAVIDDFNTTHQGNEIVVVGLSGNTTLIWGKGDNWYTKTIWIAPGALEGIAYGDFDYLHDGKEFCITGYSNTAVMLYKTSTGWFNELIYSDPDPLQTELNGVVITDFYSPAVGDELIIIGFTGKIRLLTFAPPDFELSTPSVTKIITAGGFVTLQINMDTTSGYNSNIELALTGLPPECTYNFSKTVLIPALGAEQGIESSVLTIDTSRATPAGSYNLTIIGTGIEDNWKKFINFTLIVDPLPDFVLKLIPSSTILNLSRGKYYTEFNIELKPLHQFNDTVDLYLSETYLNSKDVRNNLDYSITPKAIKPGETAVINISISEEFNKSFNFLIPIFGANPQSDLEHSVEIMLNVTYFENVTESENGSDENIPMNQLVSIILLVAVILIISIFMIKRMCDISRQEQELREQRRSSTSRNASVYTRRPGYSHGLTRHPYRDYSRRKGGR